MFLPHCGHSGRAADSISRLRLRARCLWRLWFFFLLRLLTPMAAPSSVFRDF
jgi:hypothetical protein